MNSISIVSEIVASAAALAGLILVYLGSLVSSYNSFQPQERKTVKGNYQKRAWVAFAGILLALTAAALGLLGKWLPNECMADAATIILLISFVWGAGIALLTALEIE